MEKNAIILSAGKSERFAPFTYEKPKGLFIVREEVLIERQIEQLLEARVNEIIIAIGYMKEKFFYLEQKYPLIKQLVNNTYGKFDADELLEFDNINDVIASNEEI